MSLNENGRSLYIKKFYYKEKELICHGQKCYVSVSYTHLTLPTT